MNEANLELICESIFVRLVMQELCICHSNKKDRKTAGSMT